MAKTEAAAALDACQEIAQNTILEGATVSLAGMYGAMLYIDFALSNATAHTGTKFLIQISSNTTGDEDWVDYYSFISTTGTTNLEVITNNPLAIGGTSITCAATTGYTAGTWIFLEDVSTFANSEWCFVTLVTTNTSVTVMDGVTRQHAVNSIMNSVANRYAVPLPETALRCRIVYDNTYDSDGATVAIRSRISDVTAI